MRFFPENLGFKMAHKKPQYLTTSGFKRSSVNPQKENYLKLALLKKKKKDAEKTETTKVKPLSSLSAITIPDNINSAKGSIPLKRKKISPEAAKAIAAAISGMLKNK